MRRPLLITLALATVTGALATGAGATPPGAPAPIAIDFEADPQGVILNGYSPVEMPEVDLSSTGQMRIVANNGLKWVRADAGDVRLTFARRTSSVEFYFGGDVNATQLIVSVLDGATVAGTYYYTPNNDQAINQRVFIQHEDLFNAIVIGMPGNQLRVDRFKVAPLCTWVGTSGRNVKVGTPGNDVLCGRGGDDVLSGLGGNDRIVAGSGNDAVRGGPGNDDLFGGSGNDTVNGETGEDHCDGGAGSDGWLNCDLIVGIP